MRANTLFCHCYCKGYWMRPPQPLELYFDPILTSRQRLLCRLFWTKSKIASYNDIERQIERFRQLFRLPSSTEVFAILEFCHVYDTRYHCQVCQRLRRIHYPTELIHLPDEPWRCEDCLTLID